MDETVAPFHESFLKFSAFEIIDEVVTDLLKPTSRGLEITSTIEEGMVVSGMDGMCHTK